MCSWIQLVERIDFIVLYMFYLDKHKSTVRESMEHAFAQCDITQ